MSNIEKISAYLEEEMSIEQKQQFEEAMSNDPELQREFNLQKDIIDGVKEARRLELKSMLDNVTIGGAGATGTITFGKVASAVAVIGIVAWGIYYFNQGDTTPVENNQPESVIDLPEEEVIAEQTEQAKPVVEQEKDEIDATPAKTEELNVEPVESTTENTENVEPEIKRPSAAPMFETAEADSLEAPTNTIVEKAEENVSSWDIEIDNTKKKYSFHYKFNKGKLFLYGDFDKDLYEILEFKTTSKKMLFLYYKDKFYPLEKGQVKITELTPVKEQSLIRKLEEVADINQE